MFTRGHQGKLHGNSSSPWEDRSIEGPNGRKVMVAIALFYGTVPVRVRSTRTLDDLNGADCYEY